MMVADDLRLAGKTGMGRRPLDVRNILSQLINVR